MAPMTDKSAAIGLAALGNVTRLKLFRLLIRAGNDGLIIGEVQRRMGVPASTLAHHIDKLIDAGLVEQEKRGREVVCRTRCARVEAIAAYLTENCCAGFADEDEGSKVA